MSDSQPLAREKLCSAVGSPAYLLQCKLGVTVVGQAEEVAHICKILLSLISTVPSYYAQDMGVHGEGNLVIPDYVKVHKCGQ